MDKGLGPPPFPNPSGRASGQGFSPPNPSRLPNGQGFRPPNPSRLANVQGFRPPPPTTLHDLQMDKGLGPPPPPTLHDLQVDKGLGPRRRRRHQFAHPRHPRSGHRPVGQRRHVGPVLKARCLRPTRALKQQKSSMEPQHQVQKPETTSLRTKHVRQFRRRLFAWLYLFVSGDCLCRRDTQIDGVP